MTSDGSNHITDWLPAYVLGALTADERRQVNEHLEACKDCQAELSQYRRVVDDLPFAIAQSTPPARLKGNLLKSIRARYLAFYSGSTSGTQPSSQLRKTPGLITRYLPAFSLLIILLLAVSNLILWRHLNQVVQQTNTSMRLVKLENTQYSQGAIGTLIMDPEGKYGTLIVDNLAPLSIDQQYQVWLIKQELRTNAGVFSVNADGYAAFEIRAALPLVEYDAIGISIEPAGGSPAPTGENVFNVILAK